MKKLIHYLGIIAVVVGSLALVTTPADVVAKDKKPKVIAKGLDNPRGLAFDPAGDLYVAEAGRGGGGPCVEVRGQEFCLGLTGAITRIRNGHKKRVVKKLPSLALSGRDGEDPGSEAVGPHDLSLVLSERPWVVTGLGGDLGFRVGLGENGEDLGMLFQVAHKRKLQDFVDIVAYEDSMNPDGGEVDSNPQSVLALKGRQIVAEAGGNSLLDVDHEGNISTIAVFPERMVDAPPFLRLPPGTQIPMESVPTSVVQGPDGTLYAGELTGFPFPVGEARVYRIDPCIGLEVFESDFTNIIAIEFDDQGRLLVLEIAKNGLLSGDPTGALIRVNHDGTRDELASDGLFMPTGLAVGPEGGIYISNCGVCAGVGEVIRIKP